MLCSAQKLEWNVLTKCLKIRISCDYVQEARKSLQRLRAVTYLCGHRSTKRWSAAAVAGSGAPETGRRGAQPRGNSIRLSPSPSMQGQEGRVDRPSKGEEGWCPGLLTSSSSSSASSSSLFSPSSPPRVRRGIKTQLLRGMQGGGGGGKAKRGGKQSVSTSHSDDTFTFSSYKSTPHVI